MNIMMNKLKKRNSLKRKLRGKPNEMKPRNSIANKRKKSQKAKWKSKNIALKLRKCKRKASLKTYSKLF